MLWVLEKWYEIELSIYVEWAIAGEGAHGRGREFMTDTNKKWYSSNIDGKKVFRMSKIKPYWRSWRMRNVDLGWVGKWRTSKKVRAHWIKLKWNVQYRWKTEFWSTPKTTTVRGIKSNMYYLQQRSSLYDIHLQSTHVINKDTWGSVTET